MSNLKKKHGASKMVRTALLTAIIFVMAFTPLGYFKTGGLSITLLSVPVIIGAIVMGPMTGAVLGLAFGVTSLIQCFGLEPFGTALMGINPVGTILTCLVPRVIMGFLTGVVFAALSRMDKKKLLSFAATSFLGALFNTLFFMTFLVLFFYKTDFIQKIVTGMGTRSAFSFALAFVGINGLIEAVACCVLAGAISKALCTVAVRQRL
ncbi:ECF transporter S component [Oscillospiraceae bacterium LTW-04]|nr:ECF transporter S component [Oscillospiraceae bacterium MB24-C1]